MMLMFMTPEQIREEGLRVLGSTSIDLKESFRRGSNDGIKKSLSEVFGPAQKSIDDVIIAQYREKLDDLDVEEDVDE
jgi:hypothetical protein